MTNVRASCALVWLAVAMPVFAQYQTPALDGTVTGGEYANTSGDWSMTWDATHLFVAKQNLDVDGVALVVYVDIDPLSTPTGGTVTNGSITGATDATVTPALPFRADARGYADLSGSAHDIRSRDGAGGWGAANGSGSDITAVKVSSTVEMSIRWDALPGLGGVPSSFRWLAYEIFDNGAIGTANPVPAANPTGTTPNDRYYHSITSTANGGATNPFSILESNWRVTSNADSGSDTLRDAITNANADAASSRRFITFGLGDTTITMASGLPAITRTTTIDGTSQTGGTTPAVTLVGLGTGGGDTGIWTNGASNCVFRGLVLQNHTNGFFIFAGSGNVIAGNYIGTNAAGTAAAANQSGIVAQVTSSLTIGGTAAADRNIVSGNLQAGLQLNNVTNALVQGNYVGTDVTGSSAIPNDDGVVTSVASSGTVGAAGAPNVISGNTGDGAIDDGNISYFNNSIGVTADGVSPLGNGGYGISTSIDSPNKVVGSIALPNTIAYNNGAVNAKNIGGLLIRGNRIFGNTASSITVSNVVQPAPTVNSAVVSANSLTINFSLNSNSTSAPTLSMQLDLYLADATNAVAQPASYVTTSPCYAGSTLTNQNWSVGSYVAGSRYVLIATSYTDSGCTTAGDGSSANTAIFTSTAPHVFTGPGDFSDTSKWSGNALPPAGEDFQIVGLCTFDDASPVRAYGDMTLGDGTTSGTVVWEPGNTVVLDVDDVAKAPSAPSALLDMTDAGTLRARGNFSLTANEFTGGAGTVEFTGTGKTVDSASAVFHNVTITGSLTIALYFYFDGTLDVQTGGSFSGSSATFLRPQNGATITGDGTKSFGRVEIDSGMAVAASGNFSVSTHFDIEGTFTPTASTVISGTGTLDGSGTMTVTRTGSNALGNQYAMTTVDTSTNTVEYAGTANQFMNTRTYNNLIVNNAVSVQLNGNMTVTGVMNFAQGLVMGSGNDLIVTNSSPSAVVQGTGWTRLTMRRATATGTNAYLFPVGTGGVSQPVTVTLNNATLAGEIWMQAVTTSPNGVGAGSGLDPSKDVSNTWRLNVASGTFDSFDITIEFGTSYDAGADPSTFVLRSTPTTNSAWTDAAAIPGATSITATGQLPASQYFYGTGNQLIDHYVVSASAPQSAGTPFLTTVTAEDILNITANRSDTVVTMTSDTGNAQFDSDGNGTFDDNTKMVANGTFTISTKDNVIESVTITATDANSKTGSTIVTVNLGPASGATTIIDANPTTILANGQETSTITVQAKDAGGNNYSSSAGTLLLSTDLGTLGTVTDNNDGTYTATLRAGTVGGTATISGTIDATAIADSAIVTLTTVPFGTPATITATATGSSQVQLTWTGVNGATTYEVFRSSLNSAYTLFLSTSSLDGFDNTVSANTTYLYKVRAVGTGGTSAFSGVDPATTVIFTDANVSGAAVKAIHITQLRTAVNAMRAAAGLSATVFTDPSLATGNAIKSIHITELRTAVDAARNAIGLSLPLYTDPAITSGTTKIKAAHITDLRDRTQ